MVFFCAKTGADNERFNRKHLIEVRYLDEAQKVSLTGFKQTPESRTSRKTGCPAYGWAAIQR